MLNEPHIDDATFNQRSSRAIIASLQIKVRMPRFHRTVSCQKTMLRMRTPLFFLLIACCIQPIQSRASMYLPDKGSGVVLGRVFDFENASAIDGAVVMALNRDTGSEHTGVTAADGTFFLSALPPGWYTISAQSAGYSENIIADYPVRIPDITADPVSIGLEKIGVQKPRDLVSPLPPQPILRKLSRKTDTLLEAHVRWDAPVNPPPVSALTLEQDRMEDSFTLMNLRQVLGSLPRQRSPELSSTQLLVVIIDEQGEQRGWTIIPDPRIIRAETPGPTGELSGQIIYRSRAEFLVAIPEGLRFATLKFYQPQWTGMEFSLNLLGSVSLP